MLKIIKDKSIVYLNTNIILNKFFPLIGFLFLFNDDKTNLFLSLINFFFVLIPITRRPDIESKNKLVKERLELLLFSLFNFIIPVLVPICLQKISKFPPEDFADSYTTTNKKFLFNHGRLSFNILFHSCFFSMFSFFDNRLVNSLILAICINEYLVPSLKKISIGGHWYDWIFEERIGYLHYWSRKYGWANPMSDNFSLNLCKILNKFSFLLNSFCFLFEFLGPLFLITNFSKDIWCVGIVSFHLMVFIATGILFWQNIILISLLLFVNHYNYFFVLLLCLLFIDKSKTRPLGWISTRLCEKIEIVGISEDGKESLLANNVFGSRERTLGIRQGRVLLNGNFRTFHIGETSLEMKNEIESLTIEELKSYRYNFKLDIKWLKYFKKFIEYSKKPNNWIWEKIIPEGQIFYTQKEKYNFEKPIKNIKFILKIWYLDENHKEHLLEERLLKII